MKIKKRNLLTVILALLCTIALALGVSFVMPKVEKINADAATYPVNQSVFTGNVVGKYTVANQNPTINYATLSAANSSYATITFSGGSGTMSASSVKSSNAYGYAGYLTFEAAIVVPANTEYKVSYVFDLSITATKSGTTAAALCTEILYFGDSESGGSDKSSTLSFHCSNATCSATYSVGRLGGTVPYSDSTTVSIPEITYTNNTDSDKTCTAYFGYYNGNNYNGASGSMIVTSNLSLTSETVVVNAVEPAVSGSAIFTETYTGSPIDFNLPYNHTLVDPVDVDGVALDGLALATPVSMANINLATGVFSPTLAGVYTVTFALNSTALADGITWSDGSTDPKTITYTVTRKEYTVPTISDSDSGKIYRGTDYYFDLISNQFSTSTMEIARPSGITDDGNGVYSDGLVYNAANKQFSAVNAGSYDVIFKLKDTANTTWSVGNVTTSTDQTVTITINKKPLSFTYDTTDYGMEWALGDAGTVTLIPTVCDGDTVGLSLSYIDDAGTERTQAIVAGNSLDISKITGTGTYTLCARLITDKNDANYCADNENYTITDEVYKLTDTITVKPAGVTAQSLSWKYRQTGEVAATKDLLVGGEQVELPFALGKEYFVTALGNDYMDIYTDYSDNSGFVNGFKTVDSEGNLMTGCGAVGKYKTYVAIHITDPAYAFEDNLLGNDNQYGYLILEWEITPRELDFADAEWQYTTDGGQTWKNFADGSPEYTSFLVQVRIDPEYIANLGLDPDDVNDIKLTYSGDVLKSAQSEEGQYYTAIAEIEIFNDSFKTPVTADGSDYSIRFEWRITKKQIAIKNWNSSITVTMPDGRAFSVPAITTTDGKDYSQYIVYTYTATLKDENGQDYLYTGTGEAALKKIGEQASVNNEITVTATASIIATQKDSFELSGTPTKEFTMGSSKSIIEVELTYNNVEYGSVKFGITAMSGGIDYMEYVQVTMSSAMMSEPVTVNGSNLSALMEYLVNAGEYNIVLELDEFVSGSYALSPTTLTFTIVPKQVYIPEVGREIIFTGENIKLTDYLDGYDPTLMTIDTLEKRDAGTVYTATITLKDQFNYVFVKKTAGEPDTETATKATVKAVVTGYENSVEFANDEHTAALLKWQINPYVLDSSLWNLKGSEGAVLNLPAQFAAMVADGTLDLSVGYRYYEDAAGGVIDPVFKPGSTFYTDAFLEGADASNFVFENGTIVSDKVTYSVPKGGISAVMSNVKDFVTKTWLGLPIWAWLLIGLFLLILLIIIIAVACKRRKSKEERAEAKARKEEEKARREEERQLQREKLEAERELAKAKQEAELEKIRMQAGMGMVGAGMASMAMQQPVQQQQAPVQQPAQQQQQPVMAAPAQMTGDVAMALAKIEAELVQLRANQNAPQSGYMPAAGGAGDYHSMYAEERARAAEARLLEERIRIEERARAAEQRAMLAEERYWRGGMQGGGNAIPAEVVVALLQAVNQGGNAVPVNIPTVPAPAPIAELPQQTAENTSVPCEYPPDAVITTTTTVDTTKAKPIMRQREENGNFDIDGFYDNADI